jgi:hypothetical protein
MRHISAKFVPSLLTEEQNEHRMAVATNLLQEAESDPNFKEGIITGDETCVFGYNPETKRQPSQWKSASSPRPNKARQIRSNVKVMFIVFFDMELCTMNRFLKDKQ